MCNWVSTPLNYYYIVEYWWTGNTPFIVEPNKYKKAVVKIQYYEDNQIENKKIL